ncbi:MAG: DUF3098 domain-containing protein [Bacteroidales bacterium]|nr:DUF3098 domain-containing protein [Bacteroidales bacterium]
MDKKNFALGKSNFIVMAIAFAFIILGFILMGGSSSTMEAFDPSIFSFRRIVIAPNLCFVGYILMLVGILIKDKNKE